MAICDWVKVKLQHTLLNGVINDEQELDKLFDGLTNACKV